MLRATPLVLGLAAAVVTSTDGAGGDASAYPGTWTVRSAYGFPETVARPGQSIDANKIGLGARAGASAGAAARGVESAGNTGRADFRDAFAVRMLAASILGNIEVPLHVYVTEEADRDASVTYRAPTAVFAPCGSAQLDERAEEPDPIFARIVAGTVE